jgi:integrase
MNAKVRTRVVWRRCRRSGKDGGRQKLSSVSTDCGPYNYSRGRASASPREWKEPSGDCEQSGHVDRRCLFSRKEGGDRFRNFRNPAREIDKFREQARERYLSTAELQRLGDTLRLAEREGLPWGPRQKANIRPPRPAGWIPFAITAIRLLLLTGCRSGEILNLRWSEVDLERGLLHLPDSKTVRKASCLPRQRWRLCRGCRAQESSSFPAGGKGDERTCAGRGLKSVPTRRSMVCACTTCGTHSPASARALACRSRRPMMGRHDCSL